MNDAGQYEASVNGITVRKGSWMLIKHEGRNYEFRVRSITAQNVEWDQMRITDL